MSFPPRDFRDWHRPSPRGPEPVSGAPGIEIRPIEIRIMRVVFEHFGGDPLYTRERYGIRDSYVAVQFAVPDRVTGEPLTLTYRKAIEPCDMSSERRADLVRQALIEVMAHEVDEMLYMNGSRAREPHP